MPFLTDAIGMNTWPQRPVVQRSVLAYRKERGLAPEQMAEILGVAPSYLHNLLYDKRVWPSLDVAQKLAEVLGMKLGDVVDDPGAEITGATPASSDLDRFMLRTMGSNLSKLTDAQKQAAFEAWNAIIRGYEK
jgi:transcriptional regulator with XRE-family HTH domain